MVARALLCSLSAADEPTTKPAWDGRRAIQGAWKAGSGARDGQPTEADALAAMKSIVSGNLARITAAEGQEYEADIALGPSTSPGSLNATPRKGPDQGKLIHGISKIEGDRLTLT